MARKRTHVREYYRRHHGTSDTGGTVSDHDRGYDAAEGIKEASLSSRKSLKDHEPFYAGGHVWSLEVKDDGRVHYTLGNLSDAGWFWDGDDDQTIGFFARVAREEDVKKELLERMDEEGVTLKDFKPLIDVALKENDGLYQLSGDNARWHFGQDESDYEGEKEELVRQGFSEEEAGNIVDEAAGSYTWEYEDFEKSCDKDYKADIVTTYSKSASLPEFLDELKGLHVDYEDRAYGWLQEQFQNALVDARQKLYPNR